MGTPKPELKPRPTKRPKKPLSESFSKRFIKPFLEFLFGPYEKNKTPTDEETAQKLTRDNRRNDHLTHVPNKLNSFADIVIALSMTASTFDFGFLNYGEPEATNRIDGQQPLKSPQIRNKPEIKAIHNNTLANNNNLRMRPIPTPYKKPGIVGG